MSGNPTCILKAKKHRKAREREKQEGMKPDVMPQETRRIERPPQLCYLFFGLLVVVGREDGATVLGDVHLFHDLLHSPPELVTLLRGQQPVQDHVAVLRVLPRGRGAQCYS